MLANVVRKPMAQIFREFSGKKLKGTDECEYTGSGEIVLPPISRIPQISDVAHDDATHSPLTRTHMTHVTHVR